MVRSQPGVATQYVAIELTAHPMNAHTFQLHSPRLAEDYTLHLFSTYEEAEAYLQENTPLLKRMHKRHFIILPVHSISCA